MSEHRNIQNDSNRRIRGISDIVLRGKIHERSPKKLRDVLGKTGKIWDVREQFMA
jgi:hypothetical protein